MMDISSRLVIIRGVPGMGKTTLAKAFVGYEHIEADMYPGYYPNGVYEYTKERNIEAHKWCQAMVHNGLVAGRFVVLANTFTRRDQFQPYFDMCRYLGLRYAIIEARGGFKSVHAVGETDMQRFRDNFQP
jgi:predicted kinase